VGTGARAESRLTLAASARGPAWPKSRTSVRTGAATVHVVQAVLRPRPLRTLQLSFRGRERSERSPESITTGRVVRRGRDSIAWG